MAQSLAMIFAGEILLAGDGMVQNQGSDRVDSPE